MTAHEWADPAVVAIDKLPARSTARSLTAADDSPGPDGPRTLSLDGTWDFHWSPTPDTAPDRFWDPEFDSSGWDTIEVPSSWETQGHGNLIYAPANLPPALKGGTPPSIDTSNAPVGCHLTSFDVPADWDGMDLVLHFGGVSSALYVWVNGEPAGYSQVSRCPAEFDVTQLARPGRNELAVRVHRWCDGSYLENQDMWFLSGIFRSVELRAEPPIHIADTVLQTRLDDDQRSATLDARIDVGVRRTSGTPSSTSSADPVPSAGGTPDHGTPDREPSTGGASDRFRGDNAGQVTIAVTDGHTVIASSRSEVTPRTAGSGSVPIEFSLDVGEVDLWTAETPRLYDVVITLEIEGHEPDVRRFRHGFRTVEIRDRQLLVNGTPVTLFGVNRHDLDPVTGAAMTDERIREDLLLIKQANCNALRTAHYPDDERVLDLCDELGLYVMDEADLESHGVRRTLPASDPTWTLSCVDRAERMVGRDRNRASVIIWSLGNEAGYGTNHHTMAERIRELDPTRPLHYEGDHQVASVDMFSAMYGTVNQWRAAAEGKGYPLMGVASAEQIWSGPKVSESTLSRVPMVLCEYAHCWGNSLGSLDEYVDLFRRHDHCIGGFIWDFADQGLRHELADGTVMWARGGDLTDEYEFGSFCANGIVAADRTPHPAWFQVRHCYSPVAVRFDSRDQDSGHLTVENRFDFRDLVGLEAHWVWTVDGQATGSQTVTPLSAVAGETQRIEIPQPPAAGPPPLPGHTGEVHLAVEVRLSEATDWAPAHHLVDRVHLPVTGSTATDHSGAHGAGGTGSPPGHTATTATDPAPHRPKGATGPGLTVSDERIRLTGGAIEVGIDRVTGSVDSLAVEGRQLLAGPVRPNLWRAQTDNEIGLARSNRWTRDRDLNPWRVATRNRRLKGSDARRNPDGSVEATMVWRIPGGARPFELSCHLDQHGALTVSARFTAMADLPRMGLLLDLIPELDNCTWFGRGPHESMWDRKSGAAVGQWTSKVSDFHHDYLRPQENGNRTDVRWADFLDASGRGVRFSDASGHHFEMTAHDYSQDDLADASHPHLIPRRSNITVALDHHQRGAGGFLPAGVGRVGLGADYRLRPWREHRLAVVLRAITSPT